MKTKPFLNGPTLLCFSPPIMIATIIIEVGLAALVTSRYLLRRQHLLITGILILLAIFQWAEYQVCRGAVDGGTWSRLGYVAITFLPALGIHLAAQIRQERRFALVSSSYLLAIAFAGIFALVPGAFATPMCTGNYVIFTLTKVPASLYSFYYFTLECLGLWLCLTAAPHLLLHRNQARRWLGFGYLIFMVPTFVVVILRPFTIAGIPSIMCGFAVLLALVLGLRVAPLLATPPARSASRSSGLLFWRQHP